MVLNVTKLGSLMRLSMVSQTSALHHFGAACTISCGISGKLVKFPIFHEFSFSVGFLVMYGESISKLRLFLLLFSRSQYLLLYVSLFGFNFVSYTSMSNNSQVFANMTCSHMLNFSHTLTQT